MTKLTLYATNLSSKKQHGPGRLFCAMIRPRAHEREAMHGWVPQLAPPLAPKLLYSQHAITAETLRELCDKHWRRMAEAGMFRGDTLVPLDDTHRGRIGRPLRDGDTIFCACARPERRKPGSGACHLEYLAPILVAVGWRVMLYGRPLFWDHDRSDLPGNGLPAVAWEDTREPYQGRVVVPTQESMF